MYSTLQVFRTLDSDNILFMDGDNNKDISNRFIKNAQSDTMREEQYIVHSGNSRAGSGEDYPYSGAGDWEIDSVTYVYDEEITMNEDNNE